MSTQLYTYTSSVEFLSLGGHSGADSAKGATGCHTFLLQENFTPPVSPPLDRPLCETPNLLNVIVHAPGKKIF